MPWGLRRKILYILIITAFVGLVLFLLIYPYFNPAPTCSDNKQNGLETGVDCGGACARACLSQVDQVSVLWARSFQVVPGRYNAVAYLENHNSHEAINRIGYRFRFADGNNLYIGQRVGTTFIPSAGRFAIFEPAVDLGSSQPVYTTFEFTEIPTWYQVSPEKQSQIKISISNISLENADVSPKLSAVAQNKSLFYLPEVSFIAILYDAAGNAVSASRTYLDALEGQASANLTFTWPEPFSRPVIAKEIIPMFNIFGAKLK